MVFKPFFYPFFYAVIALLIVSCSAERKNMISKTYHNLTARYNAYYYAKKRMSEVEAILNDNYDNDYDKILRIYPPIDSTLAQSYSKEIEDCIKKASIAIQRHKNSRWVDDSYIFVGMARYRSLDFVNAIDTYKFVNTESEDDAARHEALARLVRTFTDYGEFENAVEVQDYLKKESPNKHNRKLLALNKAHYYQTKEDIEKMVINLTDAAPLLKKRDNKGRIFFIIGQVYQQLGNNAEAFKYYKKCLASNPEYELDFYARLNIAQVTTVDKYSDIRSTRRLLHMLLKDRKNEEFKDRIYYETGKFELKYGDIDRAIDNYKLSIRSGTDNAKQRGKSCLALGKIYYDTLRNYELAQAYYDSAVQSLPSDYENIEGIKKRAEVLKNFVVQLETIRVQDSLLMLATMDSAVLAEKITAMIAKEDAIKEEEEKKARRKARQEEFNRQAFNPAFDDNRGIQSATWYFGNPSAVARGQAEFIRIWGDRPLEDNWRRSDRQTFENNDPGDAAANEGGTTANEGETAGEPAAAGEPKANKAQDGRFNAMYSKIPFSDQAKQAANNKIEQAYYNLANIYKYDLEEDQNAIEAFRTLIERFPDTEYHAEALYQLYLIYKSLEDPEYLVVKEELLAKFPNSIYAKLAINPNYREESAAANEKLKAAYGVAYDYYIAGDFAKAVEVIENSLSQFDETSFTPNMKLLKILITGKTEDITIYQYELGEFIKKYPEATIKPYAEKLLEASRSFQEKKRKLLGTRFLNYFDQSHYFVYLYQTKSELGDLITQSVIDFDKGGGYDSLKTSTLILDDNLAMILVSDFAGKETAMAYYDRFAAADPVNEPIRNSKFYKFVITKDNFNIFYQSKDLDTYLQFFDNHYLNGNN